MVIIRALTQSIPALSRLACLCANAEDGHLGHQSLATHKMRMSSLRNLRMWIPVSVFILKYLHYIDGLSVYDACVQLSTHIEALVLINFAISTTMLFEFLQFF